MSSKKYRGKQCVYCGVGDSATRDHVLARCLFARGRTENLPQVPACKTCNNEKSKLELYLAAVLPFGAMHDDAMNVLEMEVRGRLSKNLPLCRAVAENTCVIEVSNTSGDSDMCLMVPFDGEKLQKWLGLLPELPAKLPTAILMDALSAKPGEFRESVSQVDVAHGPRAS
jgi:hypothetical protein